MQFLDPQHYAKNRWARVHTKAFRLEKPAQPFFNPKAEFPPINHSNLIVFMHAEPQRRSVFVQNYEYCPV